MPLQSSSSSAHPFSSSSIRYEWKYDVFISFRGLDTRYGFTGNLYSALCKKGIHTFFDDDKLQSGEEITPSLLKAIENSRIAIIVLSPSYAHSSFCLEELLHILHCIKGNSRLVLPIFYEFIDKIVEDISRKIRRVPLPVADYPVGLESRVPQVISLLEMGSTDQVHMVGIHGIGGIGKTTLALAIYNFIADHFDGVCFLENVRENSQKHGLESLQKDLLCKILGKEGVHIIGVKDGTSQIQRRLNQMKVLLVLDDVDDSKQLQAIAGEPDWFGGGSRVIITTWDTHLLKLHGVERTYYVEDVLNRAITYASGHPLALELIGSNLFGKEVQVWESALDQFEKHLDHKIRKILRVSFDALEEQEQSVFLDIACCFKEYTSKEISDLLQAHYGYSMKYHSRVLVQKSLIKIGDFDKVTMHDLIEDMGKEIDDLEKSANMPGKRRRLWFYKDVVKVLEDNQKLVSLKVLKFDGSDRLKEIPDVSTLQTLQQLSLEGCRNLVTIHNSVGFLPELKILNADYCDKLRNFPPFIELPSLEILMLDGCSSLEYFPEIQQEMENVKSLVLRNTGIKDLPCSFRNLSRLSFLQLSGDEMCEIPNVIGMMPQLCYCDIEGGGNKGMISGKLKEGLQGILTHSLPSANLTSLSLENTSLSDEFFPLAVAWFPNVEQLILRGNNFTVLPACIQQFHFLRSLVVNDCPHLREIRGLPPNLEYFSAVKCKSLSPRGTSLLLNQGLYLGRSADFVMPGGRIPRWFEQRRRGETSISFWFSGTKFPAESLCLAILLKDHIPSLSLVNIFFRINGKQVSDKCSIMEQLLIFNMNSLSYLEGPPGDKGWNHALPHCENGWNHAEVSYEGVTDPTL
ncbi:hypothetical protein PIB30_036467 [Stylosanthes scabra]|uniref:TIR domain-containing protein n=1 Tax=Stylosanthes scabra TaxID=79078 RepID=A0ABU6WEM6_9FABA|nr:hypothetical protein [Stylosanthes scabra]